MRKRSRYHRRRLVIDDPVEHAIALASRLPPDQRAALRRPLRAAYNGLRTGTHAEAAWCCMADALNVAEQLASRGIVSDRAAVFLAGQQVLHAVHMRRQRGGSLTLRADELQTLRLAKFFHFVQIAYCTQREMRDAILAVQRRMQQALAGNAPRDATVCIGSLGTPNSLTRIAA